MDGVLLAEMDVGDQKGAKELSCTMQDWHMHAINPNALETTSEHADTRYTPHAASVPLNCTTKVEQ